MEFINAFLIGGATCLVFQAIAMATKLEPPKLLIFGLGLGGLLSALGIMGALLAFNTAGMLIMAIGAGDAVFGATTMALMGDWSMVALVLGIFVALILLGIVAGWVYCKKNKV